MVKSWSSSSTAPTVRRTLTWQTIFQESTLPGPPEQRRRLRRSSPKSRCIWRQTLWTRSTLPFWTIMQLPRVSGHSRSFCSKRGEVWGSTPRQSRSKRWASSTLKLKIKTGLDSTACFQRLANMLQKDDWLCSYTMQMRRKFWMKKELWDLKTWKSNWPLSLIVQKLRKDWSKILIW